MFFSILFVKTIFWFIVLGQFFLIEKLGIKNIIEIHSPYFLWKDIWKKDYKDIIRNAINQGEDYNKKRNYTNTDFQRIYLIFSSFLHQK
jgi:hypothetical protein